MTELDYRTAVVGAYGLFALCAIACEEAEDSSRIAVAGGSLTELVYLLGLEDRIVATDTTPLYPEAAKDFPSIGYVRALSTEGILSIKPTLLQSEDDAGPEHVIEQLRDLDITIRTVPEKRTAQGILDKTLCVAAILGVGEGEQESAKELLTKDIKRLEELQEELIGLRGSIIFGINDGIPTIGGKDTSGHSLLAMIGIENTFEEVTGWKPVSLESMVQANPQVLVVPKRAVDLSGGEVEVIDSKSIQMTEAGKKEQFIFADTMALLGFGPRTLTTAIEVAETVLEMISRD